MRIFALLFLWLCCSAVAADRPQPILSFKNQNINFGYAPQRATFSARVTVLSNTADTLKIGKIFSPCNCIRSSIADSILPPGDSLTVDIEFYTETRSSYRVWHCNLIDINDVRIGEFGVEATIFNIENPPSILSVTPPVIIASQYGDTGPTEFTFKIENHANQTIPLKLKYINTEYYEVDFPAYIEAGKSVEGKFILKESGKKSSFKNSLTFEFINDKEQTEFYSIPILRNLYKKQ